MIKIAAMIILAIGLTTSAAAKSQTEFALPQIIPLTGMETAAGTYDPLTNVVYGNSFALENLGDSETHFLPFHWIIHAPWIIPASIAI